MQPAKRDNAPEKRRNLSVSAQERAFWIGLGCAVVFHAALLVGVTHYAASPRRMGEHDGDPDALSVDIIDATTLSTLAAPPHEQPEAPPQQAESAPPQPESKPAQEEKESRPAQEEKESSTAHRGITPWTLDKEAFATLFPPSSPSEEKSSSQKQQRRAALQMPPSDMPVFGTGASVGRPPNITRSGENDEFGRGVVRALRRTMPSLDLTGRTTIRIFLSQTGNIQEVVLVHSSGDSHFDQSIVFAAKQASFPIPPAGSTDADRIFLVTYIYEGEARR